jgi:hypothetical protein
MICARILCYNFLCWPFSPVSRKNLNVATIMSSNGESRIYEPGDVVLTAYGVGVIVGVKERLNSVRLWRIPGKSVGSAALAFLRTDAVSLR